MHLSPGLTLDVTQHACELPPIHGVNGTGTGKVCCARRVIFSRHWLPILHEGEVPCERLSSPLWECLYWWKSSRRVQTRYRAARLGSKHSRQRRRSRTFPDRGIRARPTARRFEAGTVWARGDEGGRGRSKPSGDRSSGSGGIYARRRASISSNEVRDQDRNLPPRAQQTIGRSVARLSVISESSK